MTLDQHVPAPLRGALGEEAAFCLNPACAVVYCNPAGVTVNKGQTLIPATQKDPGDEVPVCYCFGFTRGDLRRDLAQKGATDIPDQIKLGIRERRCECERRNPQGACCLGNVAAELKRLRETP